MPRRERALRGDLDNIVAKALKKEPGERYSTAEMFAQDLRRFLAHEPVSAQAGLNDLPRREVRAPAPRRRHYRRSHCCSC